METGPARTRPAIVSNRARPGVDKPFTDYVLGTPYDEMFLPDGTPRPHAAALYDALTTPPADEPRRPHPPYAPAFLHH